MLSRVTHRPRTKSRWLYQAALAAGCLIGLAGLAWNGVVVAAGRQAAGRPAGFTDLGRVLEPKDFGQPDGTIIGDPTAVLRPDGRIDLFVYVDGAGVWRAVSRDSSGTSFDVSGRCVLIPHRPTNRRGTPWGMPRVVPIASGYRMFYMQDGGIASATSTDGMTWTQEPGLRITPEQAGVRETTTGTVVPRATGGYRMYFSALRHSPADPATPMKSATSDDMLTWVMDEGVRIGPGSTLDQNATDPFALREPDGSISAWYFVQPAASSRFAGRPGLYVARSDDGLAFHSSSWTGIPGGNPHVVVRADGARFMYLSDPRPNRDAGIRVVRLE